MNGRFAVMAIVACALVTAPATVHGAEPWLVAPPDAPPADSVRPQDTGLGEAATPTSPPVATPPPSLPTPEVVELRDRRRKAERMAIAGYVVTGVGALVCLLGMPLYISGRIEERKEASFFQEAGDPETARRQKRIGGTMMLSGLGIASVGGVLIVVGLVKKKRHERELDALANAQRTAVITPWLGAGEGGLALQGRF
jgi:hypothetical protein